MIRLPSVALRLVPRIALIWMRCSSSRTEVSCSGLQCRELLSVVEQHGERSADESLNVRCV